MISFEPEDRAHEVCFTEDGDKYAALRYIIFIMPDEPREAPKLATSSDTNTPVKPAPESADSNPANTLTPEEQMALFEKELKETDWGHQPC